VQWLAGVPHHPWFNLGGPTESIRHSRVFDAAFDESHFHDWARNETSYYALFCARWLGIMCYEPNVGSRLPRQYEWDPEFRAWLQADREVASKVERRRLLQTRESGSDVQPTRLLTEYKNRVQTGG